MKILQAILWAGSGLWTGLVLLYWAFLTSPISAPQQAAVAGQALTLTIGPFLFVLAVSKCLDAFDEATKPKPRRPPKKARSELNEEPKAVEESDEESAAGGRDVHGVDGVR